MHPSPPRATYFSSEEQQHERNAGLEDWRTALYVGSVEDVRRCMVYKRINEAILPGSDDNLPLTVAATRGREFVNCLIEAGADVNRAGGSFAGTALQHAAAEGDYESTGLLLQHGADPNAKGGAKGTALIAAVRHRKYDIAELLLNHGADANQVDGYRFASPLSVATDRDMVALLLRYGANPNGKCRDSSALIKAVDRSDIQAVHLLLQYGASADAKHKGKNALDLAVEKEDFGVIEALMAWGATIDNG